ncbi:MAG: class I SAM-dependent methyltransferase [Chitinophagaceae bacterium]|nr:class I SAM-dependent methyltransferase [Chitinophagaceae bacterium]
MACAFPSGKFTLLDVGSGNHSPSKTKKVFPFCEYHGVDLKADERYNEPDRKAMSAFYELDLSLLQYDSIPDDYFDFINMAHVIEHLSNGEEVLKRLLSKLKKGGYIYVEFPGIRSLKLPSMHGTLNFYDDPTHVRLYRYTEVSDWLTTFGCTVLKCGVRRNWPYIAAIPFRVLYALLTGKKINANIFWDITGFAEFVFARKNG